MIPELPHAISVPRVGQRSRMVTHDKFPSVKQVISHRDIPDSRKYASCSDMDQAKTAMLLLSRTTPEELATGHQKQQEGDPKELMVLIGERTTPSAEHPLLRYLRSGTVDFPPVPKNCIDSNSFVIELFSIFDQDVSEMTELRSASSARRAI